MLRKVRSCSDGNAGLSTVSRGFGRAALPANQRLTRRDGFSTVYKPCKPSSRSQVLSFESTSPNSAHFVPSNLASLTDWIG
jgi:hypothetical protein